MWLKYVILALAFSAILAKTPENLDSKYRVFGEYIIAIDIPSSNLDKAQYVENIAEKIRAVSEYVKIERTFIFKKVAFLVAKCNDEQVMGQVYDLPEVRVIEANLKQQGIAQDCQLQSTGTNLWGLGRVAYRPPPNYSNAQYSYSRNDGDATVAYVVDSGIYIAHNDYGGRAVRGYTARNLMNTEGEEDLNGHGTHCTGTIIGATYGVAKSARAIAVKIISEEGYYTGVDFLDGVEWMFNDFVQNANAIGTAYKAVASMSLGGGASTTNDLAVQECVDAGLSVVVAAMNANSNACTYSPARMTDVVTVGATDIGERLASFSNWGSCVDVLGPGVNILSTFIGSPTATQIYSGTSMATPHVAGAILRHMTQVGFRPSPAAVRGWLLSASTRDAIDLRGQTATPNLFLYAPCTMTRQSTDAIPESFVKEPTDVIKEPTDVIKAPTDVIKEPTDVIKAPTDVIIEPMNDHHHPGHQPGQDPNFGANELQEMKTRIDVIFNISIAAVVLLGLIFLVSLCTCCHTTANTERARAAHQTWYQSNIASVVNKQAV